MQKKFLRIDFFEKWDMEPMKSDGGRLNFLPLKKNPTFLRFSNPKRTNPERQRCVEGKVEAFESDQMIERKDRSN